MTLRDGDTIEHVVRRLTSGYSALWFNASGNPPLFLQRFSLQEQRDEEKQVDALRRDESFSLKSSGFTERSKGRKRIMAFIARGIPGRAGARVRRFLDDCGQAGEEFVAQARAFNAGIADADIHQALRNLWVFNSIQFYLGKPVVLTPSSFAYSLLYPYTDNWLDGAGKSGRGKHALLRWLSSQLCGRPNATADPRKANIAALLAMIRKEHSRSRRPDVHQSLLAIHRAQQKALHLRGAGLSKCEHYLVPLTVEKGGTSVLADGFLAGCLTDAQAEAIFGYGVLLQLVDDLQDLQEDVEEGHSTPFSRAIRYGTLEGVTNRLFNLTRAVASLLKGPHAPRNGHVGPLVERSCTVLIEEAVARHSHLYRRGYLSLLNKFTPVRFSYLREIRAR